MSSYCVEYNGSGFPQQKVCAIGYISNQERLGLSTVDCGVLTLGYFVPCIPSVRRFCVMFEDSIKLSVSIQYRSLILVILPMNSCNRNMRQNFSSNHVNVYGFLLLVYKIHLNDNMAVYIHRESFGCF